MVGYPLCAPPSSWWWVGPSWMVGWYGGWWGGMVSEGRLCCWCPLSCVRCPPSVYPVALLNGGSGVLLWCPLSRVVPVLFMGFPVLGWVRFPCIVRSPFVLCFLVLCCPLLLCVGVRGSARAAVRARTLSPNTIASPLLSSLLFLFCSPSFFAPRLSCCGIAVCDSPCVGVPSWHDCYG